MVRKLAVGALALLICTVLLFGLSGAVIAGTAPEYKLSVGDENYTEKITGLYLVKEAARYDSTVTIYGSSELRTYNISTHPANFFSGLREGIQVNLVGRGSCQSIIHAMSIAASGDSLAGKKVVLITSPQSFVYGGIAPDLFMANFSEQQYLELMLDDTVSDGIKDYISKRITELSGEYEAITGKKGVGAVAETMARGRISSGFLAETGELFFSPLYNFSSFLLNQKDRVQAGRVISSAPDADMSVLSADKIDWEKEEEKAVEDAARMTSNNGFGILDDYYTTYIGRRLEAQKDKDRELSYSVSEEYDDLRLLLEVCKLKGIEPLFVHVPLHGSWSDYTGFAAEKREEYYSNVRDIVTGYGVDILDLTGYEYEEYFLCDIMHLGWKGWLEVDKAIIEYHRKG